MHDNAKKNPASSYPKITSPKDRFFNSGEVAYGLDQNPPKKT